MMPDRIEMLLHYRNAAAQRGDQALVAEITVQLARYGYQEAAVPEQFETSVPRKPGRPRKTTA